jgi:transposase-like protein
MIDFKGHRFEKDILLICVRWYLAHPLSYRNLEEMMAERGVQVDHTNIYRWVCAVLRRRLSSGCESHPATFAPAGSNRSSHGGNEVAGASGVEGHAR